MIDEKRKQVSAIVWFSQTGKKNLLRCLRSLSWCQEIIFINPPSSNKFSLPMSLKKKIKTFRFSGPKTKQLNLAMEKATTRWIFFINTNEEVTPKLAQEIKEFIKGADFNGYTGAFVIRQNKIFHHLINYGTFGRTKALRIGRRVGEWQKEISEKWRFPGRKAFLDAPLICYPYSHLAQFLRDMNQTTSSKANQLYQKGEKANAIKILASPFLKFGQEYFWRGGILDKTTGFVLAVLASFRSFLTQAKLWVIWRKNGGWQR